MLTRILLSREQLLSLLNGVLEEYIGPGYCFDKLTVLSQPDESGCNWTPGVLRGRRANFSVITACNSIVADARARYDVRP
jgi:hypothetical protein